MRIAVLTHFYPPEPCAAGNRAAALAAELRKAGHDVFVITGFPNFPSGEIPAEYRGRVSVRETHDGIPVLRLWTYASPAITSKTRLLNWFSVALSATVALIVSRERVDVLYVSSPPITLALPALLGKLRHGSPLIVDIRDAYPDVAIKMGIWSAGSPIARLVGMLARRLYRSAKAITCVTETVRDEIIAGGAPPERVVVAPNGFDRVEPREAAAFPRAPEAFVVAFVGNMGLAAGVDVILDAANQLRAQQDIRFVLAGAGSEFARLGKRIEEEALQNVELLGAVPRDVALAILRDANICVVPLNKHLHDSLPTKIFDALYMSCPVLVSGNGEAKSVVERAGGGWHVPPEDPEALAGAIGRLAHQPEECRRVGAVGHDYVIDRFDRAVGVRRIVDCITSGGMPNANRN